MSSRAPGPLKKAWLAWKSLKLPWRKRFLAGHDLAGNTYWEFKDALNAQRMRRIVHYPRETHLSEIKIPPQWHQWLRHTRDDPPSLTEQSRDLVRQEQLKLLAAEADARWAAKPSFLDAPNKQQPLPAIGVKDPGGYAPPTGPPEKEGIRNAVGGGLGDNVRGSKKTMKDLLESEEVPDISLETQPTDKHEYSTIPTSKPPKEDPWKKARGGPSEGWKPKAWNPNA